MEEVSFDITNTLSSVDREYLEAVLQKSKKYGVQTGVTWANNVFSYLFEGEINGFDLTNILGFDLFSEEL